MDRTTTLAQLRHPDASAADRLDLAVDLAHWLRHGGFVPAGETRDGLLDELNQITQPPTHADDAHLEAAYENRTDMGVDW
jgi:hypothetical protein